MIVDSYIPTGVTVKKAKILVVDDQPANIKTMVKVIESLCPDVDVFAAASGAEALNLVVDHRFALAIVDVQMPEMDGFEMAELMRGRRDSCNVPIIFVTAGSSDQRQVFQGYEAGAVDFMPKPFDPRIMASKIRVFVDLYQSREILQLQVAEITRQKHQLEKLTAIADKANQAKSDFLANISHELRTPLGAILGYSELLASSNPQNADALNCTTRIQRNVEHLTELIDEILDIAKIEAGKLDVQRVPFLLLPEISELFIVFQDLAKARGLAFDLTFEGEIPESITSCPKRLRQILLNIVGNALKFTKQGNVRVAARLVRRSVESGNSLQFVVSDTGCGLTPEQQGRLFQAFSQADSSVSRNFGGTGLGLILARRLAQALGGDVVLTDSRVGQGTTFTISLDPGPLAGARMLVGLTAASLEPKKSPVDWRGDNQQLAGVRVLLVEDGPDNQILMKHFLKASGAIVDVAANGVEAVEKGLAKTYDIVLMDMQMPVLNGYEATKQLRATGFTVPVVALTANAMRGERETCIAVGCNDYLSKPVKANVLIEAVVRNIKH